MADVHWTNYVAMLTGIAGAVMGYIAYRRSNKDKSREMRIELRRQINQASTTVSEMKRLILLANNSRRAVASAAGGIGGSRLQLWHEEYTSDTELIDRLANTIPEPTNYESLSDDDMEQMLVDVHALQGQLDQLSSKYEMSLNEDEQTRKEIRENHRDFTRT